MRSLFLDTEKSVISRMRYQQHVQYVLSHWKVVFYVLSLLSSFFADKVENSSEDRVRKIKEDFEKRLANLKAELRRMSAAKREHNRMQKEQQRREMQLSSLHRDLDEMKRLKVQLLKKVKEEAKRARQLEIAHDREVAQLRREKRIKDNTIRTLETEKRQRENVLRRKHEEVSEMLKRPVFEMCGLLCITSRFRKSFVSGN